jgi:retinol dehydrogenase 12
MKTALITGANAGIGLATAKALAKRNFNLILVCRNAQKGQAAQAEIQKVNTAVKVDLLLADLANLGSVRAVAQQVSLKYPQLDVLLNNAGYTPAKIEFTPENVEKSFFASHVGHFVLTHELMPLLEKTAQATGDVRVITLSSAGHALGSAIRFFKHDPKLSLMSAYCDDKLANLLFAKELAVRTAGTGIRSYSVHPGAVRTNFGADTPGFLGRVFALAAPFMLTPERGAETSVFLASAQLAAIGEQNNGAYFADMKPKKPMNRDVTDRNARALWEKTMAFV